MYSLLHQIGLSQFLKRECVPLCFALLIAELWFKFGSFILETGGFLLTWYVFGAVSNFLRGNKSTT